MSIIQENVCRVNTQLDRFQQIIYPSASLSTEDFPSDQIRHIQDLIHAVSVTSKTQPLLAPSRLVDLLSTAGPRLQTSEISEQFIDHVSEYVWLVAAKAAAQVSGLVMKTLLDQTLRLHNEADYWNDTLESMWYTGLYAVQTSPVRLWNWTRDTSSTRALSLSSSLVCRWAQFYEIAHQSIRGRQGYPIWIHLLSPIRSCRSEVQQKRDLVKAMEEIHASSLGLLMEGWHSFEMEDSIIPPNSDNQPDRKWYDAVYRTVVLIETILQQAMHQPNAFDFEKEVVATIEESGSSQIQFHGKPSIQQPLQLVERLVNILREQLPTHTTSVSTLIGRHGRPSTMVRYWVPAVAAVLSSSASVRFMVHRQDKIIQWIINLGATIIDFGGNWVVDPIRKLIGTIRHDENSEIAIMSKNSLMADRASLERMVIDFVRDRPDPIHGSSAVDTTALANSVKEGDLTPVLRAYERDLRSPFVGTVRGDLIRALLIQIQKTKVDVEIAISGIDALLKSQELVFGFVGLTPGILVSYASLRWLGGFLGSRRGLRKGKRQDELRRGLRNITRILTSSASLPGGAMSYKDSGQLMCESEGLLQKVATVLKGIQYQEFREDIQDLLNIQSGVDKQLRVIERMRWAYSP